MADTKNLHPLIKTLMDKFLVECSKKGISVSITQGFRTIQYQNELYNQGRTRPGAIVTNCKGGLSPHNYGLAFDFCLMEKGRANWDSRNKNWAIAGAIGEKLGLTWGGRWTKFVDMPHLEYMFGLTSLQLYKGAKIPNVIKVPGVAQLKELEEKYLFRVGNTVYTNLQKVSNAKELAGLSESDLVRIGKSIYKKI